MTQTSYLEDLWINTKTWKIKTSIELAAEKLKWIQDIVRVRWKRWFDSPFAVLDKYTQWIIEWKVYTIWAFSNTWKSQLSYEYASYFLKKWKKVLFISTEVWSGELLGYIARNLYRQPYYSILKWEYDINLDHFSKLHLYDNVHTFKEIEKLAEEIQPDIIFIDFIQSINHDWASEYEKTTNLAIDMQKLAIDKNITIFSLSQVNNASRNSDSTAITLKWSWALFASSDVIFTLYRENWVLKLSIMKNKFWKANITFDMQIDFNLWWITFFEDTPDEF